MSRVSEAAARGPTRFLTRATEPKPELGGFTLKEHPLGVNGNSFLSLLCEQIPSPDLLPLENAEYLSFSSGQHRAPTTLNIVLT